MKLLIVSATQFELTPFLQSEAFKNTDVLITGVGLAAATFQLTKHLHHHHYDLVIQAGIAGSANSSYPPGSVVLVQKDSFAEIGAFENGEFKSLTDLELSQDLEWITNHHPYLEQSRLPLAKGITVTTITDDESRINALQEKWAADVESMEGAALHYVCSHLHKPYLQLRSISNMVGNRNKAEWKMQEAINNLNAALLDVIYSVKQA